MTGDDGQAKGARKRDRVLKWGVEDFVDRLIASGLRDPSVIAQRLMAEPDIATIVQPHKILPSDIRFYLEYQREVKEQAIAKTMQHDPEGRAIVLAAKENVTDLIKLATKANLVAPEVLGDFEAVRARWRDGFDSGEDSPYPEGQIRALESVVRLIKSVTDSVLSNAELKSLIKAQNANVSVGLSQQEVFEMLVGAFGEAEWRCGGCGHRGHGLGKQEALGAFARYQAREVRDSIDTVGRESGRVV